MAEKVYVAPYNGCGWGAGGCFFVVFTAKDEVTFRYFVAEYTAKRYHPWTLADFG